MRSSTFVLFFIFITSSNMQTLHMIKKRFLIFPPAAPTRNQLLVGIGLPVDLEAESITAGITLKTQYLLPSNASDLRNGLLSAGLPINKRSYKGRSKKPKRSFISTFRWTAYKTMEAVLKRHGHDGLECVLRAICDTASIPFSDSANLMSQLFHIFFTPSSTTAEFKRRSSRRNVYLRAEEAGSIGDPCHLQFPNCKFSLIDVISVIL